MLTGVNGAGKTNLLEAISFMAPGRGLRAATLSEVTNLEQPTQPWGVAITLNSSSGVVNIGTGVDPEGLQLGRERRVVKVEGETVRQQTSLAEYVHVLWLTPQMDRLFMEGAGARRKFFDRLVYGFDPLHASRINRYDHAMRERARLLREGRADTKWLEALEERMACEAVAIAAARDDLIDNLSEAINWAVGTFPTPVLSLDCEICDWLKEGPALAVEDRLRKVLAEQRGDDAISGRTRYGAHRCDVKTWFGSVSMPAAQCSTGEQKALLLSIILAVARLRKMRGHGVLLMLLDEVVAHLDAGRREDLFKEITELGVQAWMSGTDYRMFEGLQDNAQFLNVENSKVN